jgi:hypothetical protein
MRQTRKMLMPNARHATVLARDTRHQRSHVRRVHMIDWHGDAPAARVLHQRGRLFNRFGAVVLRAWRARGAPRAVHRGASRAQFDRDAAARAARCACDQRHFAVKHAPHHPTLSRSVPPRTDAQLLIRRLRRVSTISRLCLIVEASFHIWKPASFHY